MTTVLKSLHEAGIMVVASAGNEGPGCASIGDQPATLTDWVFNVGSYSHPINRISMFSSRGPSVIDGKMGPDLTAPGERIRSSTKNGGYSDFFSGTSMAGPHVVGAVALLWSADPSLIGKIAETKAILRATAEPKTVFQDCDNKPGSQVPNNTFGFGTLNIYKAVKSRLPLGE